MSEILAAIKRRRLLGVLLPAAFLALLALCSFFAGAAAAALLSLPLPLGVALFAALLSAPPLLFALAGSAKVTRRRLHATANALLVPDLYLLLCIFLAGAVCLLLDLTGTVPLSRALILRAAAGAAGAFGAILLLGFIGAQLPRTVRRSARLCVEGNAFLRGDLPSPDLRVALLSDTHFGAFTSIRYSRRVLRRVRGARPDVLLFAGDFFDYHFDDLRPRAREELRAMFSSLARELPLGILACEGNHDRLAFRDDPRPAAFLSSCGVRLLRDEGATLTTRGGRRLCVLARGEFSRGERSEENPEGRLSPEDLLALAPPGEPTIVLDHRPSDIPALAAAGADLVLCGHVHGGQSFPGNLLHRLLSRTAMGGSATPRPSGGVTLSYTTRGAARWTIPMRFFSYDEVTLLDITLKPCARGGLPS